MTEIMKIRQILLTALATLSLVSCVDDKFHYGGSSALKGTLSLSGMDIDYSEEMTTPTATICFTYTILRKSLYGPELMVR